MAVWYPQSRTQRVGSGIVQEDIQGRYGSGISPRGNFPGGKLHDSVQLVQALRLSHYSPMFPRATRPSVSQAGVRVYRSRDDPKRPGHAAPTPRLLLTASSLTIYLFCPDEFPQPLLKRLF